MKAAVIVFSPTGNTLKVGKMIEDSLKKRDIQVQLIDLSRNRILFQEKCFKDFLQNEIEAHDFLFIGSPVYVNHLQYNVKEIIKSLPKPGKGWGSIAIPFVTYGTINSGIALLEASKLLKKSGRTVMTGMKIDASHSLTKLDSMTTKINKGKPNFDSIPLIEKMISKALDSSRADFNNTIIKLKYQGTLAYIKANVIFREKFWQKHIYPKLIIEKDTCISCNKCEIICPVGRIGLYKQEDENLLKQPECIHCGACVFICPSKAINFDANWEKWNILIAKAARGEGPIVSNEMPKSAVY